MPRHGVLALVLAAGVALCACLEASTSSCAGVVCPTGLHCTRGQCALPEAIAACSELHDGDACSYSGSGLAACSSGVCRPRACGNGRLDPGEICDDRNTMGGDGCSSDCRSDETCGNGTVDRASGEECDGGEDCSEHCLLLLCGNDTVDASEECDDGAFAGGDGCSAVCMVERCGNHFVDFGEECDDGNLISQDRCSSGCLREAPAWSRTTLVKIARSDAGLVYDQNRQRPVTFGGWVEDSYELAKGVWEYDGVDWLPAPGKAPPLRTGHAMVFDAARSVLVLVGGEPAGGTWEYDGTSWTQTAPGAPAARSDHALAYDAARGVVVLFGGRSGDEFPGSTWEYDGQWHDVTPVGLSPEPRTDHAMAFDEQSQRVVLFGGREAASDLPLGDTWEWDGTEWVARSPALPPGPRSDHAMTGRAGGGVLLTAGDGFSDTWLYSGGEWSDAGKTFAVLGDLASQLEGHAMATTPTGPIVFAGIADSKIHSTLWSWSDASIVWDENRGERAPPARSGHRLVYDSARHRPILAGGIETQPTAVKCPAVVGKPKNCAAGYVYAREGERWVLLGGRLIVDGHDMVYDPIGDRLVLFGGEGFKEPELGTWFFNFSGSEGLGEWVEWVPETAPPGRRDHAMAYDSARERVVLFGGRGSCDPCDDTWEFDGTTWYEVPTANAPPARAGAVASYDESRGVVVLFGGEGHSDTWEFDGQEWTEVATASSPPASSRLAATYDPLQRVVAMVQDSGSVWSFDGNEWTSIPTDLPWPPGTFALTFDRQFRRMFLLGGWDEDGSGTATALWLNALSSKTVDESCDIPGDEDEDGLSDCDDNDCRYHLSCDPF